MLPAALRHAWEIASKGEFAQADPTQTELAIDGVGTTTAIASRVCPNSVLGLAACFDFQRCLGHWSVLFEREAELFEQSATFLVIVSRGHNGDIHPAHPVNVVDVDFVEHRLFV